MKKIILFFYNLISGISPRFEVLLRRLYWKHSSKFKKFRPYGSKKAEGNKKSKYVDFEKVLEYLRSKGVGEGSLLLVHSSYDVLECTGLSPEEIIEKLLKFIGPTGTLAMPAIRKYKGEPKYDDILKTNIDDLVCTYNVRKTLVISGMLPYTLLNWEGSEVSHHPLNPLVAYGPLAKPMMEHNLDGEHPSPHGPNSSWKYCYDHNAIVVGLGADLDHYNTIGHVNEEAFGNWPWSDKEWYRLRQFDVIDENKNTERVVVRERKPEWGMLHSAVIAVQKYIYKKKLRERILIDNEILVCYQPAKPYIDAMQELCKKGKCFYY